MTNNQLCSHSRVLIRRRCTRPSRDGCTGVTHQQRGSTHVFFLNTRANCSPVICHRFSRRTLFYSGCALLLRYGRSDHAKQHVQRSWCCSASRSPARRGKEAILLHVTLTRANAGFTQTTHHPRRVQIAARLVDTLSSVSQSPDRWNAAVCTRNYAALSWDELCDMYASPARTSIPREGASILAATRSSEGLDSLAYSILTAKNNVQNNSFPMGLRRNSFPMGLRAHSQSHLLRAKAPSRSRGVEGVDPTNTW